jgi:ABC-type multidrug transport system fused ATPase/permease subunit
MGSEPLLPLKSERLGLSDIVPIAVKTWKYIGKYRRHLIIFVALIAIGVFPAILAGIKVAHWIFDVLPGNKPLDPKDAALLGLAADVDLHLFAARLSWALYFMLVGAIFLVILFSAYGIFIFQKIAHDFRTHLYDRFQDFSMLFHTDQKIGDTIYRLMIDSPVITSVIYSLILFPLRVVTDSLTLGLVMILISWRLAVIYYVTLLVVMAFGVFAVKYLMPAFRAARETSALFLSHIEESLSFLKVIKMSGRETDAARWFERASWRALLYARRARLLLAGYRISNLVIIGLGYIAICYFGAIEVWNERPVNSVLQKPPFEVAAMSLGILIGRTSLTPGDRSRTW